MREHLKTESPDGDKRHVMDNRNNSNIEFNEY